MTRTIYYVQWSKAIGQWVCRESGDRDRQKLSLVTRVAARCRRRWRSKQRVLSQLKIMGKNGRIQSERTYGQDPARYPG